MHDDYDNLAAKFRTPRRPAKHSLAVRMFVAKLSWLDGLLCWRESRVAWVTSEGDFFPQASDLSRAQKRLNKLAQFKKSAPAVLGDNAEWIRVRRERLELAKRLHGLYEPDIAALADLSTSRDARALQRLADLIPAEALCLNPLPASPSRALMLVGETAEPFLRGVIASDFPPCVASLAAMCLGAISARHDFGTHQERIPDASRRSYEWGRQHSLPEYPGLVATLLLAENGHDLASRCLAALNAPAPFALSAEQLRVLALQNGSETAVLLAEGFARLEPVVAQMLNYRDQLPDRLSKNRPIDANRLAAFQRKRRDEIADIAGRYLFKTCTPSALDKIRQFFQFMTAFRFTAYNWQIAFVKPLQIGSTLDAPLQLDYLTWLVEEKDRIWESSEARNLINQGASEGPLQNWLLRKWNRYVEPMAKLLNKSRDIKVVRRASVLNIQGAFNHHAWSDPGLYAYAVDLVERYRSSFDPSLGPGDLSLLGRCATVQQAKELLQPLMDSLNHAPPPLRGRLFFAACDWGARSYSAAQVLVERFRAVIPVLAGHAKILAEYPLEENCFELAQASRAMPLGVIARFTDWFLTDWERTEPSKRAKVDYSLSLRMRLSAALAGEDAHVFVSVFQSLNRTKPNEDRYEDWDRTFNGVQMLARYPNALSSFARVFPHQPKRCLDLLIRLNLTKRLGEDATQPLSFFLPSVKDDESGVSYCPVVLCQDAGWRKVIALSPELAPQIAAYQHARWLLKEPAEVTPRIRNVLNQPSQWATELEHISAMIAEQPHRSDLIKRAERLKARIEDTAAWEEQARVELKERLSTVTDEAQIRALESLVDQCFFNRLKIVVGPLPEQTTMTPDLLNATLLTADITHNKKLLQRLLRGHLYGPKDWRERHPANEAFLSSLAAQGVDADAWLSEHPRRYACANAPGGRLHLRLERDPLHILQMGNYFGTCLSLDGGNAFSTVANASELNKRVIYARDGNGTVVGRKLIGIRDDGKLIGFRTYASLTDSEGNKQVNAIFRHYVEGFALRCGLSLADTGTVPKLFAEAWYDDGVAPWAQNADAPMPAKTAIAEASVGG